MTAILLTGLFAAAAALAVFAMIASWRAYGKMFAAARQELREADYRVGVSFQWRDTGAPRAAAMVYQFKFTPRAESLPFHPERAHDWRVAA